MMFLLLCAVLGQTDPGAPSRYWVHHEGTKVLVEGYFTERGTIRWDAESPFNKESVRDAIELRGRPKPKMDTPLFGVDSDKLGIPVTRSAEAQGFLDGVRSEVDHSSKLHLTVIGADADRAAVVSDLARHPAFRGIKDQLMIQEYRPGHWAVNPKHGFPAAGRPAIIVQRATGPLDTRGGKVVYKALDYSMGPEALAAVLDAEARRADPNYKPSLDPGPASDPALPFGLSQDHVPIALIAATAALIVFLPKKATP